MTRYASYIKVLSNGQNECIACENHKVFVQDGAGLVICPECFGTGLRIKDMMGSYKGGK